MSRDHWKIFGSAALLLLGAGILCGYLLNGISAPPAQSVLAQPVKSEISEPPAKAAANDAPAPAKKVIAPAANHGTPSRKVALPKGAIPNEMLVRFPNAGALQAYLAEVARAGGRVLGMIPALNAVRIGYDNPDQAARLRAALPEGTSSGFNYTVAPPSNADPSAADVGGPYKGFGDQALAWLGVPADNGSWGKGVKVALLDTALTSVPGLQLNSISQTDLVGRSSGVADDPEHGTAMASIIAGNSPDLRGVAPASQLLDFRVLDGTGIGDSFTVSQGVIDAVTNGARVISMSLGSQGDSPVLASAVEYALSHDVAVVAAVGNDGEGMVSYPAHYSGVIAVTAVDANGQRASFSNFGPEVMISAPGVDVYTSLNSTQVLDMSGTSAAVPFVSGAIAALLSQNPGMSAKTATSLLLQYANDAGAPGPDPMYGAGILSMDRVLNRNVPGIQDIALADIYYGSTSNQQMPALYVTVQNRGTTSLFNLALDVNVGDQSKTYYINSVSAGQISSQVIPFDSSQIQGADGVSVSSRVSMFGGTPDSKPTNDSKAYVLHSKSGTGH